MLVNIVLTVVVRLQMFPNEFSTLVTRLLMDLNEIPTVDFR